MMGHSLQPKGRHHPRPGPDGSQSPLTQNLLRLFVRCNKYLDTLADPDRAGLVGANDQMPSGRQPILLPDVRGILPVDRPSQQRPMI